MSGERRTGDMNEVKMEERNEGKDGRRWKEFVRWQTRKFGRKKFLLLLSISFRPKRVQWRKRCISPDFQAVDFVHFSIHITFLIISPSLSLSLPLRFLQRFFIFEFVRLFSEKESRLQDLHLGGMHTLLDIDGRLKCLEKRFSSMEGSGERRSFENKGKDKIRNKES